MPPQDLGLFNKKLRKLEAELDDSMVFSSECALGDAWQTLEEFSSQFADLENEAQDLAELQDLLETDVVNFEVLPKLVFIYGSMPRYRILIDLLYEFGRL